MLVKPNWEFAPKKPLEMESFDEDTRMILAIDKFGSQPVNFTDYKLLWSVFAFFLDS